MTHRSQPHASQPSAPQLNRRTIPTPLGDLIAITDADAVLLLDFSDRKSIDRAVARVSHQRELIASNTPLLQRVADEIDGYFAGALKQFSTPFAPVGTAFQTAVWAGLRAIPAGQTCSYLGLATAVGNPRAVRAVAAANGQNFCCIVIPCHRVIGADGSLTGYGGGLHRKQFLIDHEQRHFA